MPDANFCQGCGQPFRTPDIAASSSPDRPSQTRSDSPPAQDTVAQTCFRCSAPLRPGAKVCEACGLDVASLFGEAAAASADVPDDLRELTFFNRSPSPDPQLVVLKTYAGWLAVAVVVLIGSFTAYSWLEASNVISRLIGGNADMFSVQAEKPQRAVAQRPIRPAPNAALADAPQVSPAAAPVPAAETAHTGDAKPAPIAAPPQRPADVKVPTATATTSPPLFEPRTAGGAAAATTQVNVPVAAVPAATPPVEHAMPAATPAPAAAAPKAEVAPPPRKRVVVTQIEPNKSGGRPRNELEVFFRRWKKSFRQGVSDSPCTQQERALNQCN